MHLVRGVRRTMCVLHFVQTLGFGHPRRFTANDMGCPSPSLNEVQHTRMVCRTTHTRCTLTYVCLAFLLRSQCNV